MVGHRDRGRGTVRQMQLVKWHFSHFFFSLWSSDHWCSLYGKDLISQPEVGRLSTHQLSSTVLVAKLCPARAWVAELDSGASRVDCDLCVSKAAYAAGWEGTGHPLSLCLDSFWCGSKPRQAFIRLRANSWFWYLC